MTYIALLRGINVGGRNKLPMPALSALFAAAGCSEVRTYIQSGNVVFQAPPDLIADLPASVTAAIAARHGLTIPIILRSREELAAAAQANPYLAAGADPATLHVVFLAAWPGPERLARLDAGRSPPDTFVPAGQEIYLHCPGGLARTKLSNEYFDRTLATTSTVRNWNTVGKLLELAE